MFRPSITRSHVTLPTLTFTVSSDPSLDHHYCHPDLLISCPYVMTGPPRHLLIARLLFCLLSAPVVIVSADVQVNDTEWKTMAQFAASQVRTESWMPGMANSMVKTAIDSSSRESESGECLRDLLMIVKLGLKGGHSLPDWFIRMADSAGKIPAGVTSGALFWSGYFRQCLEVRSQGQSHFSGRYCSVYWSVSLNNGSLVAPLTQGICVPDSCHTNDMKNHITVISDLLIKIPEIKHLTDKRVKLQGVYCHPRPEERPLDVPATLTLIAIAAFVSIAIIATTAHLIIRKTSPAFTESGDYFTSSEEPLSSSTDDDDGIVLTSSSSHESGTRSPFLRLLICFSLHSNLTNLLSTDRRHEKEIRSLNGIRLLSMTWVILCHTFLFSLSVTNNVLDIVKDSDSLSFFVIVNGSFCVDSFFVLSGLLLSYNYFSSTAENNNDVQKENRNPVVGCLLLVVKRLYRILPLYVAVLIFDATLTHLGASGPFWDYGDQVTSEKVLCSKYWWYNVLFINNFLPMQQQCMAWTWYLASDIQFFLIAPILLLLIKWNRKAGLGLLVTLILSSISASFVVSFTHNLGAGFPAMIKHPDASAITDYLDTIYTKPYSRAGPYLIGMLVGLLLAEERQTHINRWMRGMAYTVLCVLLPLVLFGTYDAQPDRLSNAFYNSLSRIGWSFVVSLLVILTTSPHHDSREQFSPLRSLFCWRFFVPLSKLTYCAYLIHPLVINNYYRTLQEPLLYNGIGMLSIYCANVFLVFLIAIPVHLLFEAPFAQIFKSFSV